MHLLSSSKCHPAVRLTPDRGVVARAVTAAASVLLLAVVPLSACTKPAPPLGAATAFSMPPGYGGTRLAVLSDTDMTSAAYTGGDLGPDAGADRLSLVGLQGEQAGVVSGADVPNSVVAQPAALAVAPGGAMAVAAETTGPRTAATTKLTDLPDGSRLTVTSLTGSSPEVVQTLTFPAHPETVAFSPDGQTLAVTFGPAEPRRLALVPVADGRLQEPVFVGLPGIRLPEKATRAAQVDWHPSSRFLGVTLPSLNQEAFFAVAPDRRSVSPSGSPITVGENPFMGRFTPDGRFFVVSSTAWNLGVDAPPGTVAVTRFDASTSGDSRVVSRAPAGYGPEGLTVSPDGRWVVTTNIEFSANQVGDPTRTEYTSISLFALDGSGQITHEDTVYDDGVLSEAATVDTTGTWVATTAFQTRLDPGQGALAFWRIVDDRNSRGPKLVSTHYAVPLPRGPHTMVLVP